MRGTEWKTERLAMRCNSTAGGHGRRSAEIGRLRRGQARRCRRIRRCALALVLVAGAGAAAAQEPEAPARLAVKEIRSGLVIAPDLKLTSVDGGSGKLTGLYGGFITDRRLLIGVGAYWLTGGPASVGMAYGGGLVEWFANPGGRVDFSVRSLFGAGRARLVSDFGIPVFGPHGGRAGWLSHGGRRHGSGWSRTWHRGHAPWGDLPWPSRTAFGYHEDFLVADPQLSVHLNVTDWLRIGGGAGYRFIGRAGRNGERLRGLTASFGLQLGPP